MMSGTVGIVDATRPPTPRSPPQLRVLAVCLATGFGEGRWGMTYTYA